MYHFLSITSFNEYLQYSSPTNRKRQRRPSTRFSMADVLGSQLGDLSVHGLKNSGSIYWNLPVEDLVEMAVSRNEGVFSAHKALVTETGERTGRSPNDKFIVDEPTTSSDVNWGDVNISTDIATFAKLRTKVVDYLSNQQELFVQDLYCGADLSEALPIRVINQSAWHNAFARNMFIRPTEAQLINHSPEFTVFHAPNFEASPEDGVNSQCFVIINYQAKEVLIGGTKYAGEIKKSIFSIMNL